MSYQYFGEYLVSKGTITLDDLIDSLIYQVSSIPSDCEILRNEKIISSEDFLKIFKYQYSENVSFVEACKELNLWQADFEMTIQEKISHLKTPLGEILISKKILDLEALTQLLDEFWSQKSKVSTDLNINNAEKEPFTYKMLDADQLMDFRDHFDDKKYESCKKIFEMITNITDHAERKVLMEKSFKLIQSIVGIASILSLNVVGSLFSKLSTHLQTTIENQTSANGLDLYLEVLDYGWLLRNSVMENLSEEEFMKQPENLGRYKELLGKF